MMKSQNVHSRILIVALALLAAANVSEAQSASGTGKTRLAVVGLDHDHAWSLARLNVQVMGILDAARESARTGKAQELR